VTIDRRRITFRHTAAASHSASAGRSTRTCDEYVAKYTRCAEAREDPTQREQFRESLRWTVQSRRDNLAQTGKPNDVIGLCKGASDAIKQAASSMVCTW